MSKLIKNDNGGIEDHNKGALERAKNVDLITFPKSISGTNCFNCQWIRDKDKGIGYCFNKDVKQHVSGRMCCNNWNNDGTLRAWKHV